MVGAIIAIVFLALLWALVIFLNLPLLIAIGATVAIVVVAILVFVWKRFKARKAAGEIEKALASQADAQSQSGRRKRAVGRRATEPPASRVALRQIAGSRADHHQIELLRGRGPDRRGSFRPSGSDRRASVYSARFGHPSPLESNRVLLRTS